MRRYLVNLLLARVGGEHPVKVICERYGSLPVTSPTVPYSIGARCLRSDPLKDLDRISRAELYVVAGVPREVVSKARQRARLTQANLGADQIVPNLKVDVVQPKRLCEA